jgi:hypothetical protein
VPQFVERIRTELVATLAKVRGADGLPWPDLTQTLLAEMRFRSISRYLPESEALGLRTAFEAEMTRLYALDDERHEAERQRADEDPPGSAGASHDAKAG